MDTFLEETDDILRQATKTLQALKLYLPPNSVFIFDIDNTLLESFALQPSERKDGIRPPFPAVVKFYHRVQQIGIPIILLSGRHDSQREEIEYNLDLANIKGYEDLILRQENEGTLNHAVYKANHRQLIANARTIIGSVGNNWTDFEGGNTGLIFKIPNWYQSQPSILS